MNLKKIVLSLISLALTCSILSISLTHVDAANVKVSKSYYIKKSSKTIKKGLIIKGVHPDKYSTYSYIPSIINNGKTIWTAKNRLYVEANGLVQYMIKTNGDVFVSYESSTISGLNSNILVTGIHKNGKVFFNHTFEGGMAIIQSTFKTTGQFQTRMNILKKDWDPSVDTNSERYTDYMRYNLYSIDTKGKLKKVKTWKEKLR